jgi:hypothetical protein
MAWPAAEHVARTLGPAKRAAIDLQDLRRRIYVKAKAQGMGTINTPVFRSPVRRMAACLFTATPPAIRRWSLPRCVTAAPGPMRSWTIPHASNTTSQSRPMADVVVITTRTGNGSSRRRLACGLCRH